MFTHPSLAFLGLGSMGRLMAERLLAARYPLAVWNRTIARTDALVDAGARRGGTPAAAVEHATVIFIMVSDPPAVEQVLFGPAGAIAGARHGAIVIDCSTIDPAHSREFAERCAAAGHRYVECPVMGSLDQARTGTLVALAAGDADTISEVGPLLLLVARQVVRVGGPGSASTLKLVMNLLVGGITELLAESIAVAEKAGLSLDMLRESLMTSVLASPFLGYKAPQLLERRYDPLFSAHLMLKDLTLVQHLAAQVGASLPALDVIRAQYARAVEAGHGGQDFAVVREVVGGVGG